ncbi:MAG: aglE [Actinomycetia bacterium]|nr:aglE [Actinomycetes bacterium]
MRLVKLKALVLVLLCGSGAVSCGGSGSGASVTVLGPWTAPEEAGFRAMLAGFEKQTGIRVDYTGTRDADSVLASEIQNGKPPDAAVLATPGELRQYAAAGTLRPIDGALDQARMAAEYGPGVRDLMTATGPSGTPHSYGIIVKAALKSVIWYDPKRLPPSVSAVLTARGLTWDRLIGAVAGLGTRPWCMGMADTSNSGWPGTDWIEDLLLHQSGPRAYDQWVAGRLPWTSGQVRQAWQAFGAVAARAGGGPGPILLTNFGSAGAPMFTAPPGCFLDHEGSFIAADYANDPTSPRPGTDFDFVPFPPVQAGQGAEEIAGDLLGMFRDTPAARKLIGYLTTPAAQQAWIRRPAGGAISMNRAVPLSDYPDPVSRKIADNLTHAGTVRFDGSDSMPHVMSSAFQHAVLEYLSDPGKLDVVLTALDKVRQSAYR